MQFSPSKPPPNGTARHVGGLYGRQQIKRWKLASAGAIVGVGGVCLDVHYTAAGSPPNGTVVSAWSCNGGANQVWTFQASEPFGVDRRCGPLIAKLVYGTFAQFNYSSKRPRL